jgi:hypothetical protein
MWKWWGGGMGDHEIVDFFGVECTDLKGYVDGIRMGD